MDLDAIRAANDDPEFAMAAHAWEARVRLGSVGITIDDGRITDVSTDDGPSTIRITGPDEGWARLLAATPQPFYQDLWGAITHHGFAVEGDFEALCQYYPAVRRLIELLRA